MCLGSIEWTTFRDVARRGRRLMFSIKEATLKSQPNLNLRYNTLKEKTKRYI